MSTFRVDVVKIGTVTKHPGADTLSMTTVDGQNVIFKTGDYTEGDLAVYVPYDSMAPVENPQLSFLDKNKGKTHVRIKPIRLRKVYSEGVLIKPDKDMVLGEDVAKRLNIYKYEEPEEIVKGNGPKTGPAVPDPGILPKYDMENFMKYGWDSFQTPEEVVVTEKIHGCNFRAVYHKGKLFVGSHNTFRAPPRNPSVVRGVLNAIKQVFKNRAIPVKARILNGFANGYKANGSDTWWHIAKKLKLEEKLKDFPGVSIYGEVYGHVQDLTYGVPIEEAVRFVGFDVFDSNSKCWWDHEQAAAFLDTLDIPAVPVLYKGPLTSEVLSYRHGYSTLDNATIREGIVIRPVHERRDHNGRVVMKVVSEEYKLRNGGTEKH